MDVMLFDIEFKPRAIKDLKALPLETGRRIMDKIEGLKNDLSGDVKHRPLIPRSIGYGSVIIESCLKWSDKP